MLTLEQIENNKNTFVGLLKTISIEGADIDGLISFLEESDFFYAPASTKYHGAYDGGLCEHSLDVYKNLRALVSTFASKPEVAEEGVLDEGGFGFTDVYRPKLNYSEDTLKIVGLLHDLSKVNFYEKYSRNVKVNNTWESVDEYRVRDAKDRLISGSKGFNSFLLISKYIPLNGEEISAILNQYCGMDKTENTEDLNNILDKYNLTVFLHTADLISCYCNKK